VVTTVEGKPKESTAHVAIKRRTYKGRYQQALSREEARGEI